MTDDIITAAEKAAINIDNVAPALRIPHLLAGIFDTAREQLAVSKDIAAHLRDIDRNTALDTALIMKNVDAHIGQSFFNQARGRAPYTLEEVKQRSDEHLDGLIDAQGSGAAGPVLNQAAQPIRSTPNYDARPQGFERFVSEAGAITRPQATLVTLTPGNIRALKERFMIEQGGDGVFFRFREGNATRRLHQDTVLVREVDGTVTWHASEALTAQRPDLVWLEREIPEPAQPAKSGHNFGGENRAHNGATTIIMPAEDKPAEPEFIVWQFDGSADTAARIYLSVREVYRGYISWSKRPAFEGSAYLIVRPSDGDHERQEVQSGQYVVVQPAAKELIVRDKIGLSSMIRRIGRVRSRFMACADPTAPIADAGEKAAPTLEPGDVTDEVEALTELIWKTINAGQPATKAAPWWPRYQATAMAAMNHIARTQMDDAIKAVEKLQDEADADPAYRAGVQDTTVAVLKILRGEV